MAIFYSGKKLKRTVACHQVTKNNPHKMSLPITTKVVVPLNKYFEVDGYRMNICVDTNGIKIICLNTLTGEFHFMHTKQIEYVDKMTYQLCYLTNGSIQNDNCVDFCEVMKYPTIAITPQTNGCIELTFKNDENTVSFQISPDSPKPYHINCCNNIDEFIKTKLIDDIPDDDTKQTILQELIEFIENEICVKYDDLMHYPKFQKYYVMIETIKGCMPNSSDIQH